MTFGVNWLNHFVEALSNTDIPYVLFVTNLPKILEAIQKAAVCRQFNLDFLKTLGLQASQDRPVIKLLKYLGTRLARFETGLLQPHRDSVDHNKSKVVLADRMRAAFDDLFNAIPMRRGKSIRCVEGLVQK